MRPFGMHERWYHPFQSACAVQDIFRRDPFKLDQSQSLTSCYVVCRTTAALGFHPYITAIAQLMGTYALGILVVLCAYAGYTVTASILEVLSHVPDPALTCMKREFWGLSLLEQSGPL